VRLWTKRNRVRKQAVLLAFCSQFLLLLGCGYPGPVLPPSPEIPPPVVDLAAIERGDQIIITFHTPPRTTDNVPIKHFNEIDLRVGPALVPFDFQSWSVTAKQYPVESPPPNDPLDPQPIAMTESISLEGLLDKHVAIAVRTSIKRGDHFSSWSNRVVFDVTRPLTVPALLDPHASVEGVVLDWQAVDAAKGYRILRQAPVDKTLVEMGNSDQAHYVDTTSQFDVPYSYQVIALNGNSESLPSELKTITPRDTFAPTVPSRVTALTGPESVELSWQRSPETDLAGYYVYRAVNGGPFERQGDIVNLPAFSDRKVEHGKTYRYQISSVDKSNNESAKSAVTEVAF
jgi:hypothetical protein